MQVVTRISKIWRKRMLMLMLFALGGGAWFFYDAFIGYPKQIVRAREFQTFELEGRKAEWPAYAAARGWSTSSPGKPKTPKDLEEQKLYGIIGVLLAAAIAGYWLWSERRSISLDGDVITSPTGQKVRLEEIREVDRRKWDSKGIAVALFERDGERRKLIIDDYKYEGAIRILEEVERRLGTAESAV